MEPRKATLRVRLLPLKIKKLPINVEDRKQQNYQRKRENLKSDAAKYEEHKKADACNKRQSRKNMSDDQRKIYNEKAKLRMIKYRKTKVKQQKVITRREKEKQRRQWRESKQRHRLKMNAQQRRRENERRKQLYKETKSKVKRRINFFEQTTSTSTPKKKSATDIISEIHSSTPRTKEYLKQEGLINTPRTKSQIITDRKIVNHIKVSLKDMKKDRSRVGRSRYAWFVKNIARQAAKDFKMRQRLNLQYQFWIWATCYEPDMKDVMSERADGLPQSLKEEVSQFYYNEGEVLSCKSSVSSLGIQKVVLQSTVQQIYDKFVESSGAKLSFSAFRNLKPTECLTIDHNRFDACLCDICINVEFNIRALKHVATRHGTKLSVQNKYHANKKTLCPSDDFNDIHCTTRQCNNCGASALEIQLKEELSKALDVPVKWDKWENAVCPLTGKRRKLLVDHHGTTKECIEDLCQSQLPNLALHLFTSRWQRMQINILKKSPPQNCLISHVDFAENHRLIHQDQISSAFYNYNQATIHPSVLYYTCPNCTTSTVVEAMVFISSDLTHDAFAVHAFNQIMMDHVQNARGATISHHIQCSDRCSSQYISKKVFSIMTENEPSERIYFGSRHGKGVCDSLGGIIKNSADRFVKSRKGKIRTPKELYDFCNSHLIQDPTEEGKCVHKRRVFILVDNILRPEIKKELITLKGTQKMHHVKALQKDVVKARPFACFCEPCVSGNDEECVNKRCIGSTTWTEHVLDKTENRKRKSDKQMQCETEKKKQKPAKKNVTKQTPSRPSKSPIKTNRQTRSSSRQIVDKHQVNIQSSETETKTNTHENLREMSMCKTKRSLKLKVNKLMGSVEPFPVNKQLNIVDLSLTVDQMSLDLFPSDGPKDMYPVSVIGDGNCLSRCASLFGYYNQENYIDMKIRLSKEMIENADYYQRTYCNFAQYSEHNQPGMNTSNKKTVNAIYDKEVKAACTNGSYMGILHMAAYATVLGRTINSVYPIYGGHTVRKHLNTAIEPRTESTRNPVHIMWTNTTGKQQNENVWTPNHFVALLPLGPDVLVEDVQPTATTDDHALFDAEYLLRSPLDDEIFGVGDLPKAVLEGPDILEVGDIPEASLEGAKILGVGDIPLADLEGAEILGVCHIPDAALERAEMLGVGDIPDAILGLGDIPDAALERAEIFGLSDIPDAILGVGDMPDAALDGAQIFGVGDTDLPGAEILGAGDIPDAILGVGDIPDAILGVGDIPDAVLGVGDIPDAALKGAEIFGVGDIPDAILEVGDIPDAALEGAEILGVGDLPDAALEGAEILGVGEIPDAVLGVGDIPDAALKGAEIFGVGDIPDAILGVGDIPDAALEGAEIFGVGDIPDAVLGVGDIPDAALEGAEILGVGDLPDAALEGAEILGVGEIPDAVLGVGDIPDAALKGAEIFGVGDIPDAILGVGDLPDAALEGAEILGVGEIPDAILGVGDLPDAALEGAEILGVGDLPDAVLEGAEIHGVGEIPDAIFGVGDLPDAVLEGAEIFEVGDLPDAVLKAAEFLGVGDVPGLTLCDDGPVPEQKKQTRKKPRLWDDLRILKKNHKGVSSQRAQRCLKGSCYPATGDLLIGRENSLYASSTCGLEEAERYCIVSHLEDVKKCFYCDSRQPFVQGLAERSHRIENIVSSFRTRRRRWWQAENGAKNVYIQLNLEAEFHFTHLIMTFKTFRPAAMLVERSYDFGRTWKVYRYFAYDCEKSFPGISTRPVRKLNDVICVSRYSKVEPSSGGEVIFRVLPPQIFIDDPYSQAVQDLLKLTNLRVNFTELHTLGDNLLDNRAEIKEKYYFSLYDMTVRGSCACYGHASRCLPLSGFDSNVDPNLRPVFGRCECTHNTMGLNCEMCENFYHDQPWKPARGKTTNACKKCNCNNHATACHFDAAVYEATAKVSGGVCDDCEHNTMGRNCEQCMSYFFQDPNRDIRDPNVCQPCDCDPSGSLRKALCDRRNDEVNGLVAGRCHCKRFVDGRRCDTCTNGYWNLDDSNPDGCEACSCNLLGTIGNFGCDKATGLCRCKRYVVGRSCDQCYFGYWGLSAEQGGCRACDCDIGGALSEECDQQSGQCQCRNNIIGLKCKTVRPGFFYAGLDHNLYEAESSRGIGNARIYIREPYPDSPSSWTGRGFMKIMEGDSIEFTVDHIPLSMNYNLVLRYDPRMPEPWEDVRVTVVRRSRVDSEGACANSIPQDDFKATTIQPGSRYTIVSPQSCLEKGQTYTIRVDFNRYRSDLVTPEATLLIDSLLVVPHTESIPIFQGPREPEYMLRDFIRYRCRDMMMPTVQQELPDRCKRHIFSISAVLHDMALPCECDPIGSVNADCEEFAGQCECQPNVVGRRCDQCAPGTYGFGPQGCSPCNCNAVGSRDNFCNEQTGQCLCAPNTYGRMCDECQRGFWGFPNCRQCECNGHAEICDNQSGRCIDCTNFTIGSFCESCLDGYYGDPRDRIQIPCQPCLCPGGPGSTVQHADTCVLDPRVARVVCNCQPNYRGIHCDECAENFYGDPISPGGSCESCICNNNVNLDAPGNCDADSGECLQCLYDTEGFSCEKCAPGFFGDATMQNCQRCVCHELGTDPQLIDCDRVTGHCHCLPNVIGERCDRCDLYFWNLTSGTGCESCACDPQGSMSPECNMFDGQCECRAGRGGRTCGDCENIYWGDPRDQCYPCDCNIQGSATMQCDRHTGQCICLVGISGYKCDRCDRGTTGELPNCVPCGECFDNWDRVIRDLTSQTRYIVDEAHKIKDVGASRAFDKEFQQMEENIDEIRAIIANSSISSIQVAELEELLVQIRQNLTANLAHLDDIDKDLQDSTSRVQTGTNRISSLKFRVEDLKALAQELRKNATQVKSQEIEGAFNITREAQMRSQAAQDKVDSSEQIVGLSQQTRQEVEDLMAKGEAEFNRKVQANDQDLMEIDRDVMSLNGRIVDINQMVCDGTGDPCDALCGGGGCSSCGGPSCDNGAVTKANNALDLARKAEELLKVKEGEAQSILTDINVAKRDADEAKDEAQLAYESALVAKNHSETARSDLEDLLIRIQDFLSQSGASPADIRQLAQEVLGMSISLTPDQIRTLAQQINETISGLQNIDSILNDTKDDLDLAQRLKDRADNASRNAAAILGTAEQVLQALSGAKVAQDAADQAIKQANSDITDAEGDLTMIESETAAAAEKANKSLNSVTVLKASLAGLRKKYTENDLKVKQAETEAEEAARLADVAGRDANDLDSKYQSASDQLNSKFNMTSDARERAKNLRERANKIAADTFSKLQRLQDMQKDYEQNEKTLVDLSQEIDDLNKRMSDYLLVIQEKAKDYRDCQPD